MKKLLVPLLLMALTISACSGGAASPTSALPPTTAAPGTPVAVSTAPAGQQQILKVMTHDSFSISEQALAAFENANNVKVQFIKSGDAGSALNKAILSKNNPLADVFYGVDNTFLSRALDEGVFERYDAPALANIPAEFKLDPENRALPVDYGDVCLNFDPAYFKTKNLPAPASLDDLRKPEYKSLLVVQNPATSSPGLSFLLATIGVYGDPGYLAYWKDLRANDVLVVNDWETAYYTEFSGSSGKGPRPIVVSYNSSPAFELLYAETKMDAPPTTALTADNTCYRQVEFAGLLVGAKQPELAKKWLDFMLSETFQADMPLQMFVFPVLPNTPLDPAFTQFLSVPAKPVSLDPRQIAEKREQWLKDWTEAVLR